MRNMQFYVSGKSPMAWRVKGAFTEFSKAAPGLVQIRGRYNSVCYNLKATAKKELKFRQDVREVTLLIAIRFGALQMVLRDKSYRTLNLPVSYLWTLKVKYRDNSGNYDKMRKWLFLFSLSFPTTPTIHMFRNSTRFFKLSKRLQMLSCFLWKKGKAPKSRKRSGRGP